MSRLTNDNRDFIVRTVLDFKKKAPEKALRAEAPKVHEAVRTLLLGKHKKALDSLPLQWVSSASAFNIHAEGFDSYTGGTFSLPKHAAMPGIDLLAVRVAKGKAGYVVELLNRYNTRLARRTDMLDASVVEEATKAMTPFAVKVYEHLAMLDEVRQHVRAVVAGVTTWKKLYEVWPELMEIVPPPTTAVAAAKSTSLVVDIKRLNELIPLPTKKAAKA